MRRMPSTALSILLGGLALLLAGCGGSSGSSSASAGELRVVAAESSWGSIAAQLGGSRAAVSSIVVNPNTDPHSYEATASDGVLVARSRMALVNGLGYDSWASKLLAANPSSARVVLDVGKLLGLKEGDNPHQWYSPSSVRRVIDQIVADFKRLDPKDAAYFDQRRATFESRGLAEYNRLRGEIRSRFAGVPVGYSESIFQPLGADLGLKLITPYTEVSAADKQTVDRQAEDHAIKVWVYNSQNATPDVQRVNQLSRAAHVPIATITETPSPASANFEQWQSVQLRSLLQALHRATGR
jgi:zinc/manganese transport system substrate-binding protein